MPDLSALEMSHDNVLYKSKFNLLYNFCDIIWVNHSLKIHSTAENFSEHFPENKYQATSAQSFSKPFTGYGTNSG